MASIKLHGFDGEITDGLIIDYNNQYFVAEIGSRYIRPARMYSNSKFIKFIQQGVLKNESFCIHEIECDNSSFYEHDQHITSESMLIDAAKTITEKNQRVEQIKNKLIELGLIKDHIAHPHIRHWWQEFSSGTGTPTSKAMLLKAIKTVEENDIKPNHSLHCIPAMNASMDFIKR